MSLNGELEFRPVSNFTFSIGGRGLTYTEHQTLSIGLLEFEGTVRPAIIIVSSRSASFSTCSPTAIFRE